MRRRRFLLGLVVLLGSTLVAGAAVPAGAGVRPPEVDLNQPPGWLTLLLPSRDAPSRVRVPGRLRDH